MMIAGDRCNLCDHDMLLGMILVHHINVLDCRFRLGAVIVQTQKIRRMIRNAAHEIIDPLLTFGIVCARWADQFLALVLSQGEHLLTPYLCRMLRCDARAFGFIEEENDLFLGILYGLPIATRELAFEANHGTEGSAALEFGRGPGIPVADGGHGTFELDGVHGPGYAFVAWSIGIGPVWPAYRSLGDASSTLMVVLPQRRHLLFATMTIDYLDN